MAIQLNERDHLIFKMIEEHQVLLEKHISWFIAGEDKPVLIRDRLRKLFYLDYLLCERHGTKLPWWTTPTKPLVYMLTSMSKTPSEADDNTLDLFDSGVQRHLLEVANIRMLCLMARKEGEIKDFEWLTCKPTLSEASNLDAIISMKVEDHEQKIGLINHPLASETLLEQIKKAVEESRVNSVLLVSRDEAHQKELQELISQHADRVDPKILLFVTHHELYRSGLAHSCLEKWDRQEVDLFGEPKVAASHSIPWTAGFPNASALSA